MLDSLNSDVILLVKEYTIGYKKLYVNEILEVREEMWVGDIKYKSGNYKFWYKGVLHNDLNYKNGKRHGKCTGWLNDGRLDYEYNYKNGQFHGLCTCWYANGVMMFRHYYMFGIISNSKSWDEAGNLQTLCDNEV